MAVGTLITIAGAALITFGLFMILKKFLDRNGKERREVDLEKTPIFEVDEE